MILIEYYNNSTRNILRLEVFMMCTGLMVFNNDNYPYNKHYTYLFVFIET